MSTTYATLLSVLRLGEAAPLSLMELDELITEKRRLIIDAALTDGGRQLKVVLDLFYASDKSEDSIALSLFTFSEQTALNLKLLKADASEEGQGVVRELEELESQLQEFLARLDMGYLRSVAVLLQTYGRVLHANDELKKWRLSKLYRRSLDKPTPEGYSRLHREALTLTQKLEARFARLPPKEQEQVREALAALEVQHLLSGPAPEQR